MPGLGLYFPHTFLVMSALLQCYSLAWSLSWEFKTLVFITPAKHLLLLSQYVSKHSRASSLFLLFPLASKKFHYVIFTVSLASWMSAYLSSKTLFLFIKFYTIMWLTSLALFFNTCGMISFCRDIPKKWHPESGNYCYEYHYKGILL